MAVVESLFIVGVVAGVVALVVVGKRRGWMIESDDASVEHARSHGRYFDKDTSAGL